MEQDIQFMQRALQLAEKAASLAEVPVGSVVVFENRIIGEGYNRREGDNDPLAHAELLAIAQAARELGDWRLSKCTLYVTLEPCTMCAGALVNSRISRLVYGCDDAKAGAVRSLYQICDDARLNHRLEIRSGVEAEACSHLLSTFFQQLRAGKK